MTSTIEKTPYCRLYIATDEGRGAVQDALEQEIARSAQAGSFDGAVYKNHAFVGNRRDGYDPIESSRWTAELDSEANDDAAFETATVNVVRGLRKRGFIVTASCDFEDRISSETGWNWSNITPTPPS